MNESYAMGAGLMQRYLDSSALYLTPADVASVYDSVSRLASAERAMDLSGLPPAMVRESSRRLAIQLKEVLDRIELPPIESVPDAQAMAAAEFKRWSIPATELLIARVASGERAGEYLFTPDTLKRLPEFYAKVKALPYKDGASVGWYELSSYSPTGVAFALHWIVPPRWILDTPGWTRATLLDQPLWRWFGIGAVLGAGFGVVLLCFRISRRWSGRETSSGPWADLLRPVSLVVVSPVAALILAEVLRISGVVYEAVTLSLWTLFFLSLTWGVWVAGGAIAESVIAVEKLRESSIDSQLIRLVLRLTTIILAIAILVAGADRVGLPAYSVLAGLGVGGLAVALAAQQTLANLLGSLIIMFEKPFAIGHWIRVNDLEGIVADVGFRSTRIRTFYDSLVTIPSSQLVNSTVDNLELREHREVKTVLNLTYDTPAEKVANFVAAIRKLLDDRPDIRKDNIQVAFNDFGPHSLDIWVKFLLKAPDRLAELARRQEILLEILRLAEALDVQFAFPTQTLHVETLPEPRGRGGTFGIRS
jgi:MscS family membrane protein